MHLYEYDTFAVHRQEGWKVGRGGAGAAVVGFEESRTTRSGPSREKQKKKLLFLMLDDSVFLNVTAKLSGGLDAKSGTAGAILLGSKHRFIAAYRSLVPQLIVARNPKPNLISEIFIVGNRSKWQRNSGSW